MNTGNQTKSGAHFSVDKEILNEFKKETKKKAINMSGLIQNFMEQWIKDNK